MTTGNHIQREGEGGGDLPPIGGAGSGVNLEPSKKTNGAKTDCPVFIREICYLRVISDFKNFIAVSSGLLIFDKRVSSRTPPEGRGPSENGWKRHYVHEDLGGPLGKMKRIYKSVCYE